MQEFLPIVPELVRLGKQELESEIDYSALQLSISGTNLVQSLKNEQLAVVHAQDVPQPVAQSVTSLELSKPDAREQPVSRPTKAPTTSHDGKFRFDIAQSRHHRADRLVRDLSVLTDECQRLLA